MSRNVSCFLLCLIAIVSAGKPGKVANDLQNEESEIEEIPGGWEEVQVVPINGKAIGGNGGLSGKAIDQIENNMISNFLGAEQQAPAAPKPDVQRDMAQDSSSLFNDAKELQTAAKNSAQYQAAEKDMQKKSLQMMNDFAEEMGLGALPKGAVEQTKIEVIKPHFKPVSVKGSSLSSHRESTDYVEGDDDDDGKWHDYEYQHIATRPDHSMVPARPTKHESTLTSLEIFLLALIVGALVFAIAKKVMSAGLVSQMPQFFDEEEELSSKPVMRDHSLGEVNGAGYQTIDDETHPL